MTNWSQEMTPNRLTKINRTYLKLMEQVQKHTENDFSVHHLQDIYTHGMEGGVSDFTTYHDTSKFYEKNESLIYMMLTFHADRLGCLVAELELEVIGELGESPEGRKNQLVWYIVHDLVKVWVENDWDRSKLAGYDD